MSLSSSENYCALWSVSGLRNFATSVLRETLNIVLHSSKIRRWLPKHGIVWRHAAPTLCIKDPDKEAKLAATTQAPVSCDSSNPVIFEDEVDIHLNPKIGSDWGLRGQQRKVVTPGQNKKYFLAGALQAKTGQVTYVGSASKSTVFLINMLRALRKLLPQCPIHHVNSR